MTIMYLSDLTEMSSVSLEKFILAYNSESRNPLVKAFIADQVKNPETFNVEIYANDDGINHILNAYHCDVNRSLLEYLQSGKDIVDRLREVVNWKFNGFENVISFLDFACGSGRLTRFLLQELPVARITVSDIKDDAVAFQEKTFGVRGILSVSIPEDYPEENQYDCILISSLFSHLPEKTFSRWLKKLYNLLLPNGVLIFTVNDVSTMPLGMQMIDSGIVFAEVSEIKSLSLQDYGTTWVTESFVRQLIDDISGGKASYYRMSRGLWNQDLYVLANTPNEDFSGLRVGPIKGCLDTCFFQTPDRLILSGWAVDTKPEGEIESILVSINGQVMESCILQYERPDVASFLQDEKFLISGWSCSFSLPESTVLCDDIMMVKAINKQKIEHLIYLGLIGSTLTYAEAEQIELIESPGSIEKLSETEIEQSEISLFEKLVYPARRVLHIYRQWRARRNGS
ncbi:MAG TPA: class I SAM-dependent methyltransferase [Leptolyngbyaceae cyanobacterium]